MSNNFTPEQIQAVLEANEQARQTTSPDVLEAFYPTHFTVHDIKLLPITLASYMALEKVKSPIINPKKDDQGKRVPATGDDILKAILILSLPPSQFRKLLKNEQEFEEAIWSLSEKIPVGEIVAIGEKIIQAINMAFNTAIPTGSDEKKTAIPASAGP